MSEFFEYPLGAIIAAVIALSVSLVTIWATIRRERRDQQRELQARTQELKAALREYVDIRLGQNEELKEWIRRLERRIDNKQEKS